MTDRTEDMVATGQLGQTDRRCGSCAAWCKPTQQSTCRGDIGECRINPPSAHGWPKTQPTDWCLDGCRAKLESPKATSSSLSSADRPACLGFAYDYIRDYPEEAARWLRQAHAARLTAPETFQAVLADPMGGHVTPLMPVDSDDLPSCDDIFHWANEFDGYDNKEEDDDEWRALLDFQEDAEVKAAADEIRQSLPKDHPWVVACLEDIACRELGITRAAADQ